MGLLLTMAVLGAVTADLPSRDRSAVPLLRSAATGRWSDARTWEGEKVPPPVRRVQVRAGHTVTFDTQTDGPIRSIHVAGTLRFDPEHDTRLDVGLIKIQAGDDASESGFDCEHNMTNSRHDGDTCRPGNRHARSADRRRSYRPDPTHRRGGSRSPRVPGHRLLRRPLGCSRQPAVPVLGQAGINRGQGLGTGDASRARRRAGGSEIGSSSRPRPGSECATTSRSRAYARACRPRNAPSGPFDGTELELDAPLDFAHSAVKNRRGEVANLSRNVVIESADPAGIRGHTMYHRNSAGSISFAEFRHLGKAGQTRKVQPPFPSGRRHDAGDRR